MHASHMHSRTHTRNCSTTLSHTQQKNRSAPVIWSAENGHLDVVKRLIRAKANVETKDRTNGGTSLYYAAANGRIQVVRWLVTVAKASVDSAMRDGATPLYIAAQQGHLGVVRLLFELKANPEAPYKDGATPLYICAEHGRVGVMRYLVDSAGDRVEARHESGKTVLCHAISNEQVVAVRWLLHHGTSQPLMWATYEAQFS